MIGVEPAASTHLSLDLGLAGEIPPAHFGLEDITARELSSTSPTAATDVDEILRALAQYQGEDLSRSLESSLIDQPIFETDSELKFQNSSTNFEQLFVEGTLISPPSETEKHDFTPSLAFQAGGSSSETTASNTPPLSPHSRKQSFDQEFHHFVEDVEVTCHDNKSENPVPRHKRPSHKRAELKRRGKIKDKLEDMKDLLPAMEDNRKSSEAAILKNATSNKLSPQQAWNRRRC